MKEYLSSDSPRTVITGSPLYLEALRIFHGAWGLTTNASIFPGPQPISIERKHFPTLKYNDYMVCEKTDGVRVALLAFMFQSKKVTLLINRALVMTWVSLSLPKTAHSGGTLLDGELVGNHLILYDGVWVSGEDLKSKNLLERLDFINQFVKGIIKMAKDTIVVTLKTFTPLKDFKEMPSSHYPIDGLVFTPVKDPIKLGTHETMFKWKPRDKNTVDFQVKQRPNGSCGLYVQEKGTLIFESELTPDKVEPWVSENAIVECRYMIDDIPMWWKPVGLRQDKNYPNNRRTFYRTMVNVREDIQWEEFTRL